MRLLVKGNKLQAAARASELGIPFAFVREIKGKDGITGTLGRVGAQHLDKVQRWKENVGIGPGFLIAFDIS